jgi:hypothetical protein
MATIGKLSQTQLSFTQAGIEASKLVQSDTPFLEFSKNDGVNLVTITANTSGTANSDTITLSGAQGTVQIKGITDPSLAQDAATKSYVDNLVTVGVTWKNAARVATVPGDMTSSTYDDGGTITWVGVPTIDGETMVVGDRVVVQHLALANGDFSKGIYEVTSVTSNMILTRSADAPNLVRANGAAIFVFSGSANNDKAFVVNNDAAVNWNGGVTWVVMSSVPAVVIGGTDTQVQFNDGGVLGADAGFTYNKTAATPVLSIGPTATGTSTLNMGTSTFASTIAHTGTGLFSLTSAGAFTASAAATSNVSLFNTTTTGNLTVCTGLTATGSLTIGSLGCFGDFITTTKGNIDNVQSNFTTSTRISEKGNINAISLADLSYFKILDNGPSGDFTGDNLFSISAGGTFNNASDFIIKIGNTDVHSNGYMSINSNQYIIGTGKNISSVSTDLLIETATGSNGAIGAIGRNAGNLDIIPGVGGDGGAAVDVNSNGGFGGAGAVINILGGHGGVGAAGGTSAGEDGDGGAGGNVLFQAGVGGATTIGGLTSGNAGADGNIILKMASATSSSTNNIIQFQSSIGAEIGRIESNGQVYAAVFNAVSDVRYKTNINQLNDPLSAINKIEGYSYHWKEDFVGYSDKLQYGVLAQQLEEVGLNHLVAGTEDSKAVNYFGLIPLLIEAVKELSAKVDKYENNSRKTRDRSNW